VAGRTAWLTAAAGLLAPVAAVGLGIVLMVGLFSTAFRGFPQHNRRFEQAVRDFERRQLEMERGAGQPAMPVPRAPGADIQAAMRKMMEQQGAGAGLQAPADPQQRPAGLDLADPAPLLADLGRGDDGARAAALDRLARSAPEPAHHDAVMQALGPALSAASPTLRVAAVKALAAWASEADVPALIRPLDDEEPAVRRQALEALGRFRDARAVPYVARHLADPDARTQRDAVQALKQMGAIAEREVVRYLEATDAKVRERACQVLQVIGTRDSIPSLRRAASGRSSASRAAQAALRAIDARDRQR
jgi:hypothetical protein